MSLEDLGWDGRWDALMSPFRDEGYVPARVSQEHRGQYVIWTADGEVAAIVSGKFRHEASSPGEFPAVGDWLAVNVIDNGERAVIHAVLTRKSTFSRKAAGEAVEEQVVAANVDMVLLVSGLDGDFNVRRIERYLALAWESGATPVIVLNKADQCDDVEARVAEVESSAIGVDVVVVSAISGQGLDRLRAITAKGKTLALLGSSGVGKSTLVNALLGENRMKTHEVREDDSRGRHTTTHRELVLIPGGGVLIDTPGMREIQLWADGDAIERVFEDIAQLSAQCRFRDCQHAGEPGCAVEAAVASGSLSPARIESYRKLRREQAFLARKQDLGLQAAERAKWKQIHKEIKRLNKQ
ncbi:MAG: ribosome small subunit-dependent GTPase A [Candidatus Hydrogenedentes bacterium]|nr:ribosome small subunit-dependent GTPase A [Candidatus Hydrogenedentota bacterium]